MKNRRLLACLVSTALGASAAFALPPATDDARDQVVAPRTRGPICERERAGQRRLNWRALVEAMLPPALRARTGVDDVSCSSEHSTLLADELARIARQVADSVSGSLS